MMIPINGRYVSLKYKSKYLLKFVSRQESDRKK